MNSLNIKVISEELERIKSNTGAIPGIEESVEDLDERVRALEENPGATYLETLLGEYDGVTNVTIGVVDYTIYDAFMVLFSGNTSNGFAPVMFPMTSFLNGKAYNKAPDGDTLVMSLTDGTNINVSGAGSYGFIYKLYGINY